MSTAELRNAPIQDRAQIRLNQIKAAGIALYNNPAIGRDRFTTEQVALLANCSIGTFYRYFADRYALLDAIAPDRDQTPIDANACRNPDCYRHGIAASNASQSAHYEEADRSGTNDRTDVTSGSGHSRFDVEATL